MSLSEEERAILVMREYEKASQKKRLVFILSCSLFEKKQTIVSLGLQTSRTCYRLFQ